VNLKLLSLWVSCYHKGIFHKCLTHINSQPASIENENSNHGENDTKSESRNSRLLNKKAGVSAK
jgi:hypothetical protein